MHTALHRKYSEPGRWLHRSRWRGGQKSFWIPLFCYFPTDCCSWKSASPWKRLFNYGHNNDHFTVLFIDIYLYNDSVILSPLNKRHPQPVVNIRITNITDRIAFPVVSLFRVGKVSLHPACNEMLIMHTQLWGNVLLSPLGPAWRSLGYLNQSGLDLVESKRTCCSDSTPNTTVAIRPRKVFISISFSLSSQHLHFLS